MNKFTKEMVDEYANKLLIGLTPEEKNNIFQIAQKDFGIIKSRERVSAQQDRKDGLITGLGSNFFRLAGSVLLYGMVSAFFLGILGVIIYG